MAVQASLSDHPADGWRARKRRETRRRIADAGLRLFLEHGFEATTLDAIAEASGIARRTFFHYFASKEALLYAYEDEVEFSFRAAIADYDSGAPPFDAMVLAIREMIANFDIERARVLITVVESTETLRNSKQADHDRLERFLLSALARKWPSPDDQLRLQLIAMIGIGALRIAVDHWRLDPTGSLQDYVDRNFALLRPEEFMELPGGTTAP